MFTFDASFLGYMRPAAAIGIHTYTSITAVPLFRVFSLPAAAPKLNVSEFSISRSSRLDGSGQLPPRDDDVVELGIPALSEACTDVQQLYRVMSLRVLLSL